VFLTVLSEQTLLREARPHNGDVSVEDHGITTDSIPSCRPYPVVDINAWAAS